MKEASEVDCDHGVEVRVGGTRLPHRRGSHRPSSRSARVGAPYPSDRLGSVALRAARAGAQVTAQDLAPELVQTAERRAAEQGVSVRFDVGAAERLPYADASFDVVCSAHGIVFTVDHSAVARELARTCRVGGRLGVTYWRPNPPLAELMARVGYTRPAGADRPRDWSDPSYVRRLLGDAFELEFDEAVCHWRAESGESAWQLFSESDGPAKAGLAELASDAREALRRDWVEYFEQHREGTIVDVARPYLLVIGRRRTRRD